jgi:mono/diheme cytochrome c family protein
MKDEEAKNVTAFLRWISHIDTNGWPPEPIELASLTQGPDKFPIDSPPEQAMVVTGERLFVSKGCSACHTLGKGPLVGPDLLGIIPQRGFDYLVQWLQDPEAIYVELGTRPINEGFPPMPAMNVSREEAVSIATFLLSCSEGDMKWGNYTLMPWWYGFWQGLWGLPTISWQRRPMAGFTQKGLPI